MAGVEAVVTVARGTGNVDAAVIERFARTAQEQLLRLSEVFSRRPLQPFFVHVHESREAMPESLIASLHPDSPGFAILGAHQIHLVLGEMRRTGANPAGVIAHEIVHELLDQHVAPNGRVIPRWFHEGLAQVLAGDTYLGAREDDLIWRIGNRGLIPFYDLEDRFPADTDQLRLAYAESYSYVAFLMREYGLSRLLSIAKAADDSFSFGRVLVGRLERNTLELEQDWHSYLLNESGAPWRVALDSCFSLCLVAALPLLVLALMRRLRREENAARQLALAELRAQHEAEERRRLAAEQAVMALDGAEPTQAQLEMLDRPPPNDDPPQTR